MLHARDHILAAIIAAFLELSFSFLELTFSKTVISGINYTPRPI